MSTRSIVARVGKSEGEFSGIYVHWDGSPTTRVPILLGLLKSFRGNLPAMLKWLIDEHPRGWAELHPTRRECRPFKDGEGFIFTHETFARGDDGSAEWVFAFDEENRRLYLRDVVHKEDAGFIDLTLPCPTREELYKIECGETLERCRHCAWVHFPELKGSNIGTQTYLGRRPFELHDAVAFIINGKRYVATGSGGNSNYFNSHAGRGQFPPDVWVSSVKARNGRHIDLVTAQITKDGYTPYTGVQWVMPPTRENESETVVGGNAQ